MPTDRPHIPHFSVLLIAAAVAMLGLACLPGLHIQRDTDSTVGSIQVSFSCPETSQRSVESQVTSVLEGAFNTLSGVAGIRSVSRPNGGTITISYKKGTDAGMARFELSTRLRSIRDKLPEHVSQPTLSSSFSGGKERGILSYLLYANLPEPILANEAERRFTAPLAAIEGIEQVRISKAEPEGLTIVFRPERLQAAGITPDDLVRSLQDAFDSGPTGLLRHNDTLIGVRLTAAKEAFRAEEWPVRLDDGDICRLDDLCDVISSAPEAIPGRRINGLPTVSIDVSAVQGINTIAVGKRARNAIEAIRKDLPAGMSLLKTMDEAETLEREVRKILLQGTLSLLMLMGFIRLISRERHYPAVILSAVVSALLLAILTCRLTGITFSMYSLAGLTISLGIIMDTAIVVTDHLAMQHRQHIGGAVTGALLTTVGALLVLKMRPDGGFGQMEDFFDVILISLGAAFVTALTLVPALLSVLPIRNRRTAERSIRSRRRILTLITRYGHGTRWCRRHRLWLAAALVLSFGLPLHLLPAAVKEPAATSLLMERLHGTCCKLYNQSIGSSWYQIHRRLFEDTLGGVFHFFATHVRTEPDGRTDHRNQVLTLEASFQEGSDLNGADQILRKMEQYLQRMDDVVQFRTVLSSASAAQIQATFRPTADEAQMRACKQRIWTHACRSGGASWTIYGIDNQVLSNNIRPARVPYGIYLTGYNYDQLCRYASQLVEMLSENLRVVDAAVMNAPDRWAGQELTLWYDREEIIRNHMNISNIPRQINQQVFRQRLGSFRQDGAPFTLTLTSAERSRFDRWRLEHDDSATDPVIHLATIRKQHTGNDIVRNNQAYELFIGYQFIGPDDWAEQVTSACVRRMNEEVLPMGYHADSMRQHNSPRRSRSKIGLVMLVILVIFLTGVVQFESLRDAGVLLVLILTGMTGFFLALGLTGCPLNQGGLAAIIMLCGLAVNTGIYMLHELRNGSATGQTAERQYLKAFSKKFLPSLLTIVSTVLGLVPFLFDKNEDAFWFTFAAGVSGGMLFSVAGLVIFLPAFLHFPPDRRHLPASFRLPSDKQNGACCAFPDGEKERMVRVKRDNG